MQFVSWAALLTLLVRDLAEMASPDAAATVRADRLHPRQGNQAPARPLRPLSPPAPAPAPPAPVPSGPRTLRTPAPPDSPASAPGAGTPRREPLSFS